VTTALVPHDDPWPPTSLWGWESRFIHLMADIKNNGIKIDRGFCARKSLQGEKILREIRQEIGFNPGSRLDLERIFLVDFGFPVVKTTDAGNPSFDKYAMEKYDELLEEEGSELAKQILRHRGWQKTVSSNYKAYLDLADDSDILHPNYKLHGTLTCRLSCEHPNLQQIPRESTNEWNGDLKQAFIPRTSGGVIIEFDAKQLETRLAAAYAEEESLLQAFHEGVDVFDRMAEELGWERQDAKLFTYMTLYGAGVRKIRSVFGVTLGEAEQLRKEFFGAYPNLRKIARYANHLAHRDGFVEYWTGRRRHFNPGTDEHRKAFNSTIQGGAFEIVKRAMLRLRQLKPDLMMVLQVHDSVAIEFDTPPQKGELLEIQGILQAVPEANEMGVPFDWDYKVWGEAA
jgi:DNA polymerase I